MVPQPRGHVQPGPRVPQDRSLRWLGPAGDRRDTAPTASQCQAARGQPGSSPPLAHLTVLFPGRLAGHSQPWPQQRRAACPLLQRAHQPQERGEPEAASCGHAPACRSRLAPVGRSPAFCSKKTCAGASSGCSHHPSTSGVLIIHSYTWHFNPLKAIPSNNNNTATSCVRTHSLYRIPCLQKPSLLLCYPKHLLPLT